MAATTSVMLKPVVRFREFPFGTINDPTMREFVAEKPWENQDKVLEYLRSGMVMSVTMGANLTDWLDRTKKANPIIDGHCEGGTTEMTDGVWFWHAGLIYFIEKYNVPVSNDFIQYAARHNWRVNKAEIKATRFDFSYF